MNAMDNAVHDLLLHAIDIVPSRFQAMVIYSDAPHFSVGADLAKVGPLLLARQWAAVEAIGLKGQNAFFRLKHAPFPVIGAAAGLALGGGCELLMHCSAIQAHTSLQMGLVESKIGMLPGWGGCKELILRHLTGLNDDEERFHASRRIFDLLFTGKVCQSPTEAQALRFLRKHDEVIDNRGELLSNAKAMALRMVRTYTALSPYQFSQLKPFHPGVTLDQLEVASNEAAPLSDHDRMVAEEILGLLNGKFIGAGRGVMEIDLLIAERRANYGLVKQPVVAQRILALLDKKK
jgi:3-hydroxyacyl-CoA dehydrogenase